MTPDAAQKKARRLFGKAAFVTRNDLTGLYEVGTVKGRPGYQRFDVRGTGKSWEAAFRAAGRVTA